MKPAWFAILVITFGCASSAEAPPDSQQDLVTFELFSEAKAERDALLDAGWAPGPIVPVETGPERSDGSHRILWGFVVRPERRGER